MVNRTLLGKLGLLLVSLVVLSPLAVELFIRGAIAAGFSPFREPILYANPLSDDAYWKLRARWDPAVRLPRNADPELGWVPQKSESNPLGVFEDTPSEVKRGPGTILFFGDSFVQGAPPAPMSLKIPQQLDRMLPSARVFNYGVSGYGVDQTYLRFRRAYPEFDRPIILFGITTEDIDRTALSFRDAPKPYFTVENDRLVLQGVPIAADQEEWFRRQSPGITSYLWSFFTMQRKLRPALGNLYLIEDDKTDRKQQVTAKIIEDLVGMASREGLQLVFVTFVALGDLRNLTWRDTLLREQFAKRGARYVDTREVLGAQAMLESRGVEAFYYPSPNGHPNERGNAVIAAAVARYLHAELGVPIDPAAVAAAEPRGAPGPVFPMLPVSMPAGGSLVLTVRGIEPRAVELRWFTKPPGGGWNWDAPWQSGPRWTFTPTTRGLHGLQVDLRRVGEAEPFAKHWLGQLTVR